MDYNNHINEYFNGIKNLSNILKKNNIEKLAKAISKVKKRNGRIFFLGVGGSAGNSSHAVNDFRKLCKIESYSCFDNISELTARINDEGWDHSISGWLKSSFLNKKDSIFIFSVGGGDLSKKISVNIVNSIKYAKKCNCKILGIVGKNGGYTSKKGDYILQIPSYNNKLITPLTESFQTIIWHMLVSNPKLQVNKTKW
jgi:D-sedoheptulose 7-phosphate isomerase